MPDISAVLDATWAVLRPPDYEPEEGELIFCASCWRWFIWGRNSRADGSGVATRLTRGEWGRCCQFCGRDCGFVFRPGGGGVNLEVN